MLITAIEPRRKCLSAVYIDGEFAMNLDTATLLENHIKIGTELTDSELYTLIQASNTHRAKEKALYLIGFRDHSKKELTQKVSRSSSVEAATQAVERLEELGLVNDSSYALRYAKDLLNIKHMSPRGIQYKLQEKGIDRDLVENIIEELAIDPQEHLCILIEKKYINQLSDEKGKRRAIAAMQRLGYGWSDIKEATNKYINKEDY